MISVPSFLNQTSSSEWNSSEDLTSPLSELEDSQPNIVQLIHHSAAQSHPFPLLHSKSQIFRPENRSGMIQDSASLRSQDISFKKSTTDNLSSSDSSTKSGSSDQERNDTSATEVEEKFPGFSEPRAGSSVTGEWVIPTTYFTVDGCMSDTYRAKYHKKRPALFENVDSKTGEQTSSGESDQGEALPALGALNIPVLSSTKKEAGNNCTLKI